MVKTARLFGAACCGCVSDGQRKADRDGDGSLSCRERAQAAVETLVQWNPVAFAVLVALMISPMAVVVDVFTPCWCVLEPTTRCHASLQ